MLNAVAPTRKLVRPRRTEPQPRQQGSESEGEGPQQAANEVATEAGTNAQAEHDRGQRPDRSRPQRPKPEPPPASRQPLYARRDPNREAPATESTPTAEPGRNADLGRTAPPRDGAAAPDVGAAGAGTLGAQAATPSTGPVPRRSGGLGRFGTTRAPTPDDAAAPPAAPAVDAGPQSVSESTPTTQASQNGDLDAPAQAGRAAAAPGAGAAGVGALGAQAAEPQAAAPKAGEVAGGALRSGLGGIAQSSSPGAASSLPAATAVDRGSATEATATSEPAAASGSVAGGATAQPAAAAATGGGQAAGSGAGGAQGGAASQTEARLDAAEPEQELEDDEPEADVENDGGNEVESAQQAETVPEAPPPADATENDQRDPESIEREQALSTQREEQVEAEQQAQAVSGEHDDEQAETEVDAGAGPTPEGAELGGPEKDAALGELGEELPAEAGADAGGGGGGGGGAAAEAPAAAPDVGGMAPEQGLAALAEATPQQALQGLGGVQASAREDAVRQTGQVQASQPETTLGEPNRGAAAGAEAGAAGATKATPKAASATAAGAEKTKPAPTPEPPVGNAADKVPRPQIAPPAEGAEPSAADKARLGSAIAALPSSDPALKQRLGTAPTVALTGDADPAQVGAQKAKSEEAVAAARAQDAADVARPMGEQDVRPTLGVVNIRARVLNPGASGAAGALAGGSGGDKAAAILAEEMHGAGVRAAMAAAAAKAAAAKADTQAKVAASQAETRARIGGLKDQAAADQDAARAKVRADAQTARVEHARQQEAATTKLAQSQQDTLTQTGEKVGEEKRLGDEAAQGQIEEGDRQVEGKQQEVESQVQTKKQEVAAASEEKGFFGRLADSVGAWFDRAKQWISDKVEAGKRWIRDTADRFKKYAAQKIDQARDRVAGLIKTAGAALITLSDAVLSEFPAARAAVRGAIQSGVNWGVNKTNQIAEGAKAAVNKAVDLAAAAAEGLLDLGGKAVNAVIDGAKATAVGALNAADKVAQALGVLRVLIEDVASDPIGWISNLAAAARDGVRNFLASVMKAAIKTWWEGKLESVLGVGAAVWALLKKGGLGLKEIGAMAWSAIKAAIPPALIQLVIEKLVSMIIPAAGAVLAVIEGLQAAWGSVSAIIGAVGKAIAFLKSVRGGGGAAAFAQLVAAAAVVVIDFVSNWLLLRLGKAILKIGGKIKGIASKLMGKVSRALKKARRRRKAKKRLKARKKRKAGKSDPKKKDKAKDKEKAKRDRLKRAVQAIAPALQSLLSRGVKRAVLWAKLTFWRLRHRLSLLKLNKSGTRFSLTAKVNPEDTFGNGLIFSGAQLSVLIRQVVREELLSHPKVKARAEAPSGRSSTIASPLDQAGHAMQMRGQFQQHGQIGFGGMRRYQDWPRHQVSYPGAGLGVTEGRARMGARGAGLERVFIPGVPGDYPNLAQSALPGLMKDTGMTSAQLGAQMQSFAQGGPFSHPMSLEQARMLGATSHLIFGAESARSAGNLVLAPMTAQLTQEGGLNWTQALSPRDSSAAPHLPMSRAEAPRAARGLEHRLAGDTGVPARPGGLGVVGEAEDMARSEEQLVVAWVTQVAGGAVAAGSEESIRLHVRKLVRDWYRVQSPSRRR